MMPFSFLFRSSACGLLLLITSAGLCATKGPGVTDQQLLDAVDATLPGLEAARKGVQAGDLAAAKQALAAYLRGRTSVRWWFDPHKVERGIRHNKAAADHAVAGKVRVVSIWHTFPDGEINWLYNPTIERKELAVDHEWQWQLGRMHFWRELGRTYWATADEAYARAFVRQLRSWAAQCPRPGHSGNRAGSAWRTIECGIRMGGSWPEAYHRFLRSPSFTDDDVLLYLAACIEHGRHLRQHPTSGNWLTMEMSGLYNVGAVFPELKEAKGWRTFAIERLHEELNRQFLPDGAQIELTPGYHQVALFNILKIPDLARLMGRMDELPEDFVARAERAFDYNLFLMTPDRDLPKFNDSWHVNVAGTLAKAAELFPGRKDFAWVATDGKQGEPPAETSHAFPYAGYCAMRSGWERDANYLCLDAGLLGYGHVHQDKLNVVVWAYGREVLFDAGGGPYERSKWRAYDTDTFAHNTVLVDGQPQRRSRRDRWANVAKKPLDVRWESSGAFDFAAGVYGEGYGKEGHRPLTHTRRVLFVKPDLFIVADTLASADGAEHTAQARWHLASAKTTLDKATWAVATADEGKPNLAVVPLLTEGLETRAVSAQTEPELLGWYVRKDKKQSPATTVVHTRKVGGVGHLLTLLVPLEAGEGNPVREVKATGPASAEVVLADGRRLAVAADPDPKGRIRFSETLANGQPGRRTAWEGAGDP